MTTGSIVFDICKKYRVARSEFFGPYRAPRISKARKAAVLALREAGLSHVVIARLIKRDRSTVFYWTSPRRREQQIKKAQAKYRNTMENAQ